jgi:hypothetical protein
MATIGKVSAVFTASTSGLRTGVNQASGSMQQMQQSVAGLRGQLSTLTAISGAQLFGQIASAASQAVRSLVGMGQAQADLIGRQKDLAVQLGMSYSELAGIAHVASITGVGIESVATAATKADVALVKAQKGSKQAQSAFAGLGLDVAKLAEMNAADRFNAIAESIANIPGAAGRAAAAVAIFGKSGANLLPMFEEGAAGIAAAQAEAERLGLTLTTAQVSDVDQMGDSFARAQQAVAGVVQQVVAYLAPAIEGVTTAFSDLIGNVGGATIGQTIGDGILQGARFLAQIGDYLIQNLSGVFSYLSEVGGQWSAVWEFGQRVASFFAGIGDSLQAAFGILILGITGPVQALMTAAQSIGNALGIDTSGLDVALAGVQGFNDTIVDGITENLDSAATNFANAFGTKAEEVGQAIPGPLTQTLDAAIARAQEAAAAVDVAKKQTIEVVSTQQIDARQIREAVQGTDSRSTEGIREMFRLMRGDNDAQVQERIAAASERTAAALERGDDIEFDVADLAPAAGA